MLFNFRRKLNGFFTDLVLFSPDVFQETALRNFAKAFRSICARLVKFHEKIIHLMRFSRNFANFITATFL